jgi:hypothetical protein
LRFAIAFALKEARKLVRGASGLSEEERYQMCSAFSSTMLRGDCPTGNADD